MRPARPKSISNESEMSQAIAAHLGKYAAREVKLGSCKFDVVSYDKRNKIFRLVECKRSSRPAGIGRAFGQLAAYAATLATTSADDFLTAYSRKLQKPMDYHRWAEATNGHRSVKVAFYVGLTNEACRQIPLLRSLKTIFPKVGILRVKTDGRCRPYLRNKGEADYETARPVPVKIRIPRFSANPSTSRKP